MKQRAISAIFFVIVMLGGIFGGNIPFLLLFLVITAGCLWEFTGLMFRPEGNHLLFRRVVGTVLGCLPFLAISILNPVRESEVLYPPLLAPSCLPFSLLLTMIMGIITTVFLLFIVELFLESRQPIVNMGHYVLGVVYLGVPFALLISISYGQDGYAPLRVLGLLLLTWTNDTMAYLVGSQIGRTPFFPRISPKKTWEGTLGGMVLTFVLAGLFSMWMPVFSFQEWMGLAAAVAVFGTVGDLVESMLKRSMGVKDSGSIMPGHGGFLDRFDSFIFVLPFAWFVLLLLES